MAEQIRDTQIIVTEQPKVSPLFSLPPDAVGISYADPDNDDTSVDDSDVTSDTDPNYQDPTNIPLNDIPSEGYPFIHFDPINPIIVQTNDPVNVLPTPQNISIVSQTVRWATDTSAVVDLVIQFDDVDGAVDYEIRVAKH